MTEQQINDQIKRQAETTLTHVVNLLELYKESTLQPSPESYKHMIKGVKLGLEVIESLD